MENKIRVFISYSSKDKLLVDKLDRIIRDNGMYPLWAKKLPPGKGFDKMIKIFIQHSHVFMPILSEKSSMWVHEEIGYAMGLNIPVMPVTIDEIDPGGMLQMIQAIQLSSDDLDLKKQLDISEFISLINEEAPIAMYRQAAVVEDRAEMMADYAGKLNFLGEYAIVRQKGGLSSFHIPKRDIAHPVWKNRYTPDTKGKKHKEKQREERLALEIHAREKGCRLIIDPSYAINGRSAIAAKTRLKTLIEFLESVADDKVVIALKSESPRFESLTLVGDWFLSESVSFSNEDGYSNTFFTRNATEIAKRIKSFETELAYLLEERGWNEYNSKHKTIELLNKKIKAL